MVDAEDRLLIATDGASIGTGAIRSVALRKARQQRLFGAHLHLVPTEHASEEASLGRDRR